jgi:NlpC/P60 family putative phage cell wall peptidase
MMPAIADEIVAAARGWIGTPYLHQASVRGHGCDCLGLVRGVWREVCGAEPDGLPRYTRDWGEVSGEEHVLELASRLLQPAAMPLAAGDLIVFRWQAGTVAKHLGIATGPARFIHSWEGSGVAEVSLVPFWRARIARTFRFPRKVERA